MLILSRNKDETIRIGDEIFVTVLEVKGKQVRIGIDAPRGIAVHRDEIYQRTQAEASTGVQDKELQIELAYQQHQQALARGEA